MLTFCEDFIWFGSDLNEQKRNIWFVLRLTYVELMLMLWPDFLNYLVLGN